MLLLHAKLFHSQLTIASSECCAMKFVFHISAQRTMKSSGARFRHLQSQEVTLKVVKTRVNIIGNHSTCIGPAKHAN